MRPVAIVPVRTGCDHWRSDRKRGSACQGGIRPSARTSAIAAAPAGVVVAQQRERSDLTGPVAWRTPGMQDGRNIGGVGHLAGRKPGYRGGRRRPGQRRCPGVRDSLAGCFFRLLWHCPLDRAAHDRGCCRRDLEPGEHRLDRVEEIAAFWVASRAACQIRTDRQSHHGSGAGRDHRSGALRRYAPPRAGPPRDSPDPSRRERRPVTGARGRRHPQPSRAHWNLWPESRHLAFQVLGKGMTIAACRDRRPDSSCP